MSTTGDDRPPLSEVVVVRRGPDTELRVAGEVDIATSPDLDDTIAEVIDEQTERLVLDLSGVTFLGSSGLASLLRARRRATEAGGTLVLRHPSRAVSDLLEMTRLADHFTIDDQPG